ncbi:uncharacterized protein LOC120261627 isoform X2 [Dioscorea cayenensis subsp. rotundata]|uniref:Uncharacterized protein LOC120261627 isoform X2 n=1 Tax=Dioscorea cayennensis subsp. rotundata TaxID=55577 RepID=A0AB40BDU8_DIOCR|nr:uncharacterized protein LOC120261627 isoform X2 [Dioscorea cayenensis subsp. rotundata]
MGANCCVATKEKPLPYENRFEISNHRNIRNSPSWSFRWDNRTHIEDIIDTPIRSEIKRGAKPETEGIQGRGAPLNKFRWQKSFTQTGTSDQFDVGVADRSTEGNSSPEGKKSIKSFASNSDTKPSMSIPSTPASSVFRGSPSSTRSHSLPSDPTSSVNECHSQGYQFSSSPEAQRSFGVSQSGSSDAWSMRTSSESVMSSSQRDRWSIDNENHSSISSKVATTPNSQLPSSLSADLQTCGVCAKLLKHRPRRRIGDEIPVVSVLVCGHVYHADCLESVTPETDRYDPSCPVCTYGDKYKSLILAKAELKARSKIPRITVIDIDSDPVSEHEKFTKDAKLVSNSSMMKSTFGQPFLRRHFSMAPRSPLRSVSESEASSRKRGFWARYQKESKKGN